MEAVALLPEIPGAGFTSRRKRGLRAGPMLQVRGLRPEDYAVVSAQVDAWNRGRFTGVALPRSFFEHFADTSLLLHQAERLVGVLVGFRSQTCASVAYIHFVSVEPGSRRLGLGRVLYEEFLELARTKGCSEVHSIAPPVNTGLIAFHRQLGFEVANGGGFSCGIAVSPDYAGPGQHRVLFRKALHGCRTWE